MNNTNNGNNGYQLSPDEASLMGHTVHTHASHVSLTQYMLPHMDCMDKYTLCASCNMSTFYIMYGCSTAIAAAMHALQCHFTHY